MAKISKAIRDLHFNVRKNINSGLDPKKYLNYTQFQIVKYLLDHEGEEVCQKDLEIETKLKKASITGAIDSLEDKNIVKRIQSNVDKRKNYIVVTQKVEDFKKNFEKRIEDVDNNIVRGISEQDLDVFLKVIDKMNENMVKEKQ